MVGAKMNRAPVKQQLDYEFSEWFELAKAQGLLKLSKRQKG